MSPTRGTFREYEAYRRGGAPDCLTLGGILEEVIFDQSLDYSVLISSIALKSYCKFTHYVLVFSRKLWAPLGKGPCLSYP